MKLTLVYLARDRYRPLISPVVLLRRIRRFECIEAEKFFPVSAEEAEAEGGERIGALLEARGARSSAK